MTPYPHLFTPIKIGGQLIKNRIFSAPTGLMSYTARGHLTTENMAYYELKAKGGCGVVTLGESIVHAATGQSHDRQICLDDPHVLPSLTNTARAITRYGAVANIELSHGGKYAGLASIGGHKKERRPAYGPSHDILPSGEEVLEMPQKLACIVKDGHAGDESQTIRPAEHAGELHYLFPAPDYLGDGGIGKISAGLQQFGDPLAKDLLRGDTRVADIGVIHIENHLVLVGYQNIIVQLVHNVLIIHHAVGYLVDRGFNFGQLIQQSLPLGGSGGFTQPGDQYVNPVFRMEHD